MAYKIFSLCIVILSFLGASSYSSESIEDIYIVVDRKGVGLPPGAIDFPSIFQDKNVIYLLPEDPSIEDIHGGKIVRIKDFYESSSVEHFIINFYRDNGEKNNIILVARNERDILRAGKLRTYLALPGQQHESARCYRDKIAMRNALKKAGLIVPRYQKVLDYVELSNFIDEVGFPIVLKTYLGAGSINAFVIRSEEDLLEVAKKVNFGYMDENIFIAECFVNGEMYQVDGYTINGKVQFACPSRLMGAPISFGEREWIGIMMIDDEQLSNDLCSFSQDVINALPETGNSAFHLELFHNEKGFIVCEIGSRVTGALVSSGINEAFGIDLNRINVELQASLPLYTQPEKRGSLLYASIDCGSLNTGIIDAIGKNAPFDWVVIEDIPFKRGDLIQKTKDLDGIYGQFLISGETEGLLEERALTINNWFQDNLIITNEVVPCD